RRRDLQPAVPRGGAVRHDAAHHPAHRLHRRAPARDAPPGLGLRPDRQPLGLLRRDPPPPLHRPPPPGLPRRDRLPPRAAAAQLGHPAPGRLPRRAARGGPARRGRDGAGGGGLAPRARLRGGGGPAGALPGPGRHRLRQRRPRHRGARRAAPARPAGARGRRRDRLRRHLRRPVRVPAADHHLPGQGGTRRHRAGSAHRADPGPRRAAARDRHPLHAGGPRVHRHPDRGRPRSDEPMTIPTPYEDLLREVLETGNAKGDRTGTGTRSLFGRQLRYDLSQGFPLITTKRVHTRSIILELLWFLRGDTNVRWLQERGVSIWDEWAREDGDLGPVYGAQWRSWPTPDGGVIDQITDVIEQIRTNPESRRLVVSAWNPADIPQMALAPCHALFQFEVHDGKLSCQLYQRSADMFLGVPFNIASYALLTHMVAQQTDLAVGDFVWTGGDCHIYDNHVEQVQRQLSREPFPYPTLRITRRPESILGYELEDFEIEGYQHHKGIKAPVAV